MKRKNEKVLYLISALAILAGITYSVPEASKSSVTHSRHDMIKVLNS